MLSARSSRALARHGLDRAWWRARTGKPDHRYTALHHTLRAYADELACTIDFAN
jgi:hypothetical protein